MTWTSCSRKEIRTQIGTDGITLSGGQKQRVCLARALYHGTDIVICDDVLRGLDADTEDQVFRKVFSANGILRCRKATVVLSTHSVRYLPFADHIIALNENGTISEQGTFHELVANQGYVYGLNVEDKSRRKSDDGENTPTGVMEPADKLKLTTRNTHATRKSQKKMSSAGCLVTIRSTSITLHALASRPNWPFWCLPWLGDSSTAFQMFG